MENRIEYTRWVIYTKTADITDLPYGIVDGCAFSDENPEAEYYRSEEAARKAFKNKVSDVGRTIQGYHSPSYVTVTECYLCQELCWRYEDEEEAETDYLEELSCESSPMPETIAVCGKDYKRIGDEWVEISIYGRTADQFAALVKAAGHDTDEEPELYTGEWQLDLPGLITAKETSQGFEIEG